MKPNFLELWEGFLAQQRAEKRIAVHRDLTTAQLKTIWDAFDGDAEDGMAGYFWPDDGPHIEDVHRLLNERGEGLYCAI